MAEPTPTEVKPWYLRNITEALALDESTGNVYMRTGFTGNIVIEGNVSIPGEVTVVTSEEEPLFTHTHIYTPNDQEVSNTNPFAVEVVSGNITGNVIASQGTDPWVVSGNVSITSLPEVEVKNDANNPLPISANTSVNSATNPIYVEGVNNASFFAPTQSDAFGRLRVSNPYTLFDTRAMYYDHGQFASNLVSSGNVAYSADSSTYVMTVTGSGDAVYRETFKTFIYQPGKSLLVLNTFCGNTPAAGLTQRVGYFNDENGIYFEVSGTTKNMVIRSSSTGSLTSETIPQSSWNGDRLDGSAGANNPSGITLNVDRDQIFWMDVEWLGVGSVRTGFVIDGQFIVCHTFHHANQSGNVTTYMGTANLPLRYELISTGAAANLRQICSTVISEGGYQLSGEQKSVGHDFTQDVSLPNDDSFVPVFSIRLKSTMPDAIVIPTTWSLSVSSNDTYAWKIYRRAVTSGGSWTSAGADSSVEYNPAPTAVVSGDIVDQGFIRASNQSVSSPQNQELTFENQLLRDPFTGTRYEFVIAAATTGTNQTALAAVQWQQIS